MGSAAEARYASVIDRIPVAAPPLKRDVLVSEQNCRVCVSGTSTTRSDQKAPVATGAPVRCDVGRSSLWRGPGATDPRRRPCSSTAAGTTETGRAHVLVGEGRRRSMQRNGPELIALGQP